MKKLSFLVPLIVLAIVEPGNAANFAALAQPPTMLNMVILIIACACFVFCIQLLSLVRGGYLSKSWLMFMIGFGVLALGQISRLMIDLEIVALPTWLIPTLMAVMAGAFLNGLLESKRSLS